MSHTPHTLTASYLVLIQEGAVLLQRRFQTGWMDGMYSLPAGHTEVGENFTQTLIREIKEEIGIEVSKNEAVLAHIMHRLAENKEEYVDVFYTCRKYQGTPTICEPDKCDDLSWFPLGSLPENILPYIKNALEDIQAGIVYSEYGW